MIIKVRDAVSIFVAISFVIVAAHPFIAALTTDYFNWFDEIFLAVLILLAFLAAVTTLHVKKALVAVGVWVIGLILLSFYLGRNPSKGDILLQGFLQAKFFIFVYAGLFFLDWKSAGRALKALLFISIVGALLNLIWSNLFFDLGLKEVVRMEVFSVPRIGGFQLNPNRLGRILALTSLLNASILRCSKKAYVSLLLISFIVLVFTGSRVSLALFMLGIIYQLMKYFDKAFIRGLFIAVIVVPVFVGGLFLGVKELRVNSLGDGIGEDSPVFRVLLVTEGGRLALDNFPFGTGLASYATPFADDVGVYQDTVIGATFFFNKGAGLFDSNLASILGETGFLGLVLFFVLYWFVISRNTQEVPALLRLFIAVFIVLILCFESLLQNAITSAAFSLFLSVIFHHYKSVDFNNRLRSSVG